MTTNGSTPHSQSIEGLPVDWRQTELRYRTLVENLPNSVVHVLDQSLNILFAGGGLAKQVEYLPAMHVGRNVRDITPPAVYAEAEPYLLAALAGQATSFDLNYSLGTMFHVCATPLAENSGPIHEILVIAVEVSAWKKAEQALAEAAQFAQSTLDGLTAHIAIVAGGGEILAVNHAWRKFARANAADAAGAAAVCEGANYLSVVTAAAQSGAAGAQQWLDAMRAVLEGTSATAALEYSCHSPTEQRWFVGRITRFGGTGPARLIVAHENITERKLGELALRKSETALRRSQAIAHVGHWTWDTHTNTVSWSDEMKRIFGLDPATFAGDLEAIIDRAVHPDDVAAVRALNTAVLEYQQPGEVEYRVVWQDGSVHYVRATPGDQLRDADGHIAQLSGVVQDVTERKLRDLEREQMLQQLQEQAEQLAQVMRSVPEGVLLLDEEGSLLLANIRAEELLSQLAGYDGGQRLLRLGDQELKSFLAPPPAGRWHTLSTGRQIYEIASCPVDSGPVATGFVLVLREVTAERALQEQLQRQERLAAVGQLAAGIAHDFNNIMSVISIYAELTSEAPGLSDYERGRTHTIMSQAQRATRLIRQILDFSRQSVFERHSLDLLPLLKEEEKLLKQTLPESIEIRLQYSKGEYLVLADATRMQQLVMNLAVNARDAMPDGGTLELELAQTAVDGDHAAPLPGMSEGKWVRLRVGDSGCGIASEHMAHVFEPFFTTKAPGEGTGLGLAQAHGIVAQHDGQITVASEPGVGTVFTIYLPALAVAAPNAASAQRTQLPLGQGECVLLVEDDDHLRSSLVDLLTNWHFEVLPAANGEEALSLLAQQPAGVDVILSDVVMPRMGGIALVKALRKAGLEMPVLLMTGHTAQSRREELAGEDVDAWLDKPPNMVELAQALRSALALR